MADGFEEGTFDARSDCTATTSDRVRDVRPIGETTSAHRARAAQRAYHPPTELSVLLSMVDDAVGELQMASRKAI